MHEISAYELCMVQSDLAFWLTGPFSPGRECDFIFCNRKDPVVGDGDLMGSSQSTTRNDTVHVHMITKPLVPCMENLDDSGCCAEILLVVR